MIFKRQEQQLSLRKLQIRGSLLVLVLKCTSRNHPILVFEKFNNDENINLKQFLYMRSFQVKVGTAVSDVQSLNQPSREAWSHLPFKLLDKNSQCNIKLNLIKLNQPSTAF